MDYCHLRGDKVDRTLNTLLFDRELPLAAETGRWASDLGVDAVLVQDLGVARLLRDTCPDLPLHASTQMTVHDLDGVLACADLGMTRVVLAREMPAEAIRALCQASPVEIEVLRPRGPVHVLQRPVRPVRRAGGPQRQPGAVRPALPPGLPLAGGEEKHPPPVPEGPLPGRPAGPAGGDGGWPA